MRTGAFEVSLLVNGKALREETIEGSSYVLATPGDAFEVEVHNRNKADYMVRLFIDGTEAEPGYVKRLRGEGSTIFRGFLCKRDVHEFLFAKTPVDDKAAPSARPAPSELGQVRVLIYATRRVRVDNSSSDEEAGHYSSNTIAVRALPEKAAIKELGVQARAGSRLESLPHYRRRRRGDYRLEKVTPHIAKLHVYYRDDFWWERRKPAQPARDSASGSAAGSKKAGSSNSGGICLNSFSAGNEVTIKSEHIKREPGESTQAPDGKRRKLAHAGGTVEVIELSD